MLDDDASQRIPLAGATSASAERVFDSAIG